MDERPWHRHYPPGVPHTLAYEELAVPAFLERTAARIPARTAIAFLGRRITWRALAEAVRRLSASLAALGVGPGTTVAIHLPNLPQAVIAYYAALALGARVVLTNPLYTPREIAHQWKDAECRLAVTADFLYARVLAPIRADLPAAHYVVASIPDYLPFPKSLLAPLKLRRQDPPAWAAVPSGAGVHRFRDL